MKNETLQIIVHRKGGGHKEGTFTGPAPKIRVDVNDYLQWDLQVVPTDDTDTPVSPGGLHE